jgi:multisubunit Na+/H+ antiporter MnhB subunit
MHFIAGVVVAMTSILFYQLFFKKSEWSKSKLVMFSVAVTMIVGLLWEYFELYFEITSFADGLSFWTDTLSDLFLDTVGGYLGALYSIKISKNE